MNVRGTFLEVLGGKRGETGIGHSLSCFCCKIWGSLPYLKTWQNDHREAMFCEIFL